MLVFNAYTDAGYLSRIDYLTSLSQDYGVPLNIVLTAAETLGSNEDFDGLLTKNIPICRQAQCLQT